MLLISWIQSAFLVFFLLCLGAIYFQPQMLINLLKTRYPDAFWCQNTSLPICALTIDDAPSANTEAILDILKQNKVHATFFIIASNVPGREHILKRMAEEGHTLGNHFVADEASIKDPLDVFEKKLLQCNDVISQYQR